MLLASKKQKGPQSKLSYCIGRGYFFITWRNNNVRCMCKSDTYPKLINHGILRQACKLNNWGKWGGGERKVLLYLFSIQPFLQLVTYGASCLLAMYLIWRGYTRKLTFLKSIQNSHFVFIFLNLVIFNCVENDRFFKSKNNFKESTYNLNNIDRKLC